MPISHPRLLAVSVRLEILHAFIPVVVVAVHAAHGCLRGLFAWAERGMRG